MDYALLIASFTASHGHHGWPRQRLLHECLRAAIRDGTLAPGTRLVATRALAAELGVARNTVLYAYEQLASEGYVATGRSGTVVAALAGGRPRQASSALPYRGLSQRAQNLRNLTVSAAIGAPFVPGVPDLPSFPIGLWRRMLERAWRNLPTDKLNYGDPCGEPVLREAIADYLRASRGVVCEPAQVFITDGSQSSLDLCGRACADAGETLWMENPGYGGAMAAFRAASLRLEAIDVDEEGIAPRPQDWQERPPRLIYTTPSHQYPTGTVLSLARRLALIDGARACGALIIEDDYDSEFRHDGPPLACMQGLQPDAPVLYCGTFSKTMFPGLRIGYLVVPPWLVQPLAAMRQQSASRGRAADQLALAEFLRSGQFALHLRRMRRLYRERRDALVQALHTHLGSIASVQGASAGMHLSLRWHDPRLSDVDISRRIRATEGIVANALSVHAVGEHSNWHGLALGYGQVAPAQMDGLVRRLASVVHLAAYENFRQKFK
ncbi:PLP-dependent aminotransferase family protein [Pseudoduganella sp.]|uniref:MocR-like pyridoxine biosynthesis transcription factor PdxR n=1 Tax=Pseudoduganella sp. TaxID=1880898 RepID=UPI0035B104FF